MSHKTPEQKHFDHELTLHHRKPRSIGGARKDKRNLSWISRIKHAAWHTIFSNYCANAICFIINDKFLDPDYKFVCVKQPTPIIGQRKLFYENKEKGYTYWPQYKRP